MSIYCNAANSIMWYYESKSEHPISSPICHGSTLRIKRLKSKHAGNYFCSGESAESTNLFIAMSKLVVYGENNMLNNFIVI